MSLHIEELMKVGEEKPANNCGDNCTEIFWIKVAFIIGGFIQGMVCGLIPVWNTSCRTSPKMVGIANSFSAGLFIAIGLMHVLPEENANWAKYSGAKHLFPLPEVLCFVGYTIILLLDKVLFDTHALFDAQDDGLADPADRMLAKSVVATVERMQTLGEDA